METTDQGILRSTGCKTCDHCTGNDKKRCRKECGCVKCKKNCDYPLPEEVMDLIFRIESFVYGGGEAMGQYICNGYPEVNLSYNLKLRVYKDILSEMYKGLYSEDMGLVYTHCVCPDQFPIIKSRVVSIIGTNNPILENETFDASKLDQWLISNPKQVTFDRWERVFYDLDIVPDIVVTPMAENTLKFVYEVAQMEKPNIQILTTAIKKADCKLDVKSWTKKMESCDLTLKYSSFIKNKSCNIKYEAYVSATKCGFTQSAIEHIYNCGFTIGADESKDKCIIKSTSGLELICNKENFSLIIQTIDKCNIL